jgi:hypothetical protein
VSVELIELTDRVFEAVVLPDAPGFVSRTLTVRQLSGPETTDEQWERLAEEIVATLRSRGAIVHGVTFGERSGAARHSRAAPALRWSEDAEPVWPARAPAGAPPAPPQVTRAGARPWGQAGGITPSSSRACCACTAAASAATWQ